MAASSEQLLPNFPYSRTDIDLEDLPRQTDRSPDGGKRPVPQFSNQRLGMWVAKNLRVDSRRNTNPDKVFENISGYESLKKNYGRIAGRPNLHTAERIFIFKSTAAHDLSFAKYDTWSACFGKILSTTETNDPAAFEVCVVSTDTTNIGRTFSFIDKLFLITDQRRQQVYTSLSEVILRIFQSQWGLSDDIMAKIMESVYPKRLSLSAWRLKLPSHETHTQIDNAPHVPKYEFKWVCAPHYTNDLSVYVFRPYGEHPQAERLNVILPSSEYEQVRRAIVVVNSHSTLTKLRRNKFHTRVLEHNVFSLSYTLHLFQAACSEATAELVGFTAQACEEINYMVYEGRLRPSVSKMHYLRHLEDCHLVAKDCCKANRYTLQLLLDQVNSIQRPRADEEAKQVSDLEMVLNDLDYLHDEIESSLQRIPYVRRNLQENLDLLQIRRTSVLGILAALYLPLSFVASFLGMNLDQFTTQPFWRNATVIYEPDSKNHSIPSHNISSPNVSSHNISSHINDFGAVQTWSLANFFEIAMPLMIGTILVPLVIGSIIRAFLQGLAQGRTWWRLLLTLIVICYSFVTPSYLGVGSYVMPFWIFILPQFFVIIRNDRKNWLRIIYWLVTTIWSVIIIAVPVFYGSYRFTAPLMSGTHALSLFVFWWWKPDFYYSWDQGRRPKPKED